MLSTLRIAAAGAAAALVLCSVPSWAGSAKATFRNDEGAIHFMYTPEYAKKIGWNPAKGEMNYYGGPVLPTGKVVSVIWGSSVNKQTVDDMPGFLKAESNSTFLDQLAEYSTKGKKAINGHKSTNQTIKRGKFIGQYVITPQNQHTTLQDHDIHVELKYQISQGNLPPNTTDVLYMIYFPANVTIDAFGLQSCVAFGAYHFATVKKRSPKNIFYGVMPDCGYSFNQHTIISSHEFAEATTDNIPTPGTNPDWPQAWNNSGGYEIGDLCQGTQGQLTTKKNTYFVQQIYLNSTAGCSTGNYTSP